MVAVVAYGDSITQGIADAGGRRVIDRSIPGKGVAANNLMAASSIPAGHPVICSFGWNDIWMADSNPARYQELVTNRLLAVAERAQGQPIVLLGLEPLSHQRSYQIGDRSVARTNTLLENALEEAGRRAASRGLSFNADFVHAGDPAVGHRVGDGLHYSTRGANILLDRAMAHIEGDGRGATRPVASEARASIPPSADRQNLSRDQVRAIQTALQARGFDPGDIDGIIGRNTMAAWRRYEVANLQTQLTAAGFNPGVIDGLMGRDTQGAINRYEAARGPLARHDNGMIESSEVQALLNTPARSRPPQGRG